VHPLGTVTPVKEGLTASLTKPAIPRSGVVLAEYLSRVRPEADEGAVEEGRRHVILVSCQPE